MNKMFLLVLILLSSHAMAQRTDKKLQRRIQDLIHDFHGEAGVYVHDFKQQ